MDIREIFKGCLYSIKFDEADTDEYSRVLALWKDLDYLVDFFKANAKEVDQPFWREVGLNPDTSIASPATRRRSNRISSPYTRTRT